MVAAKTEVSVIGSGSWATALVKMLSGNASGITWFIHEQEIIDHIIEHNNNPRYLSMINHNLDNIHLTNDINLAFDNSETIILVIPSAFLKDSLEGLIVDIKNKTVCSAIKGIVPEYNQIVGDFLYNNYSLPYDNLVVLTGPTHAEEIAMEKLTYLTIASNDSNKAVRISGLLQNYYLRTVISNDIIGTEYAAVIKIFMQ